MKIVEGQTDEIIKSLEFLKNIKSKGDLVDDLTKDIKYVDREEDPELKEMYEQEKKRFENLAKEYESKVDGEIDMDMHGNIKIKYHN